MLWLLNQLTGTDNIVNAPRLMMLPTLKPKRVFAWLVFLIQRLRNQSQSWFSSRRSQEPFWLAASFISSSVKLVPIALQRNVGGDAAIMKWLVIYLSEGISCRTHFNCIVLVLAWVSSAPDVHNQQVVNEKKANGEGECTELKMINLHKNLSNISDFVL